MNPIKQILVTILLISNNFAFSQDVKRIKYVLTGISADIQKVDMDIPLNKIKVFYVDSLNFIEYIPTLDIEIINEKFATVKYVITENIVFKQNYLCDMIIKLDPMYTMRSIKFYAHDSNNLFEIIEFIFNGDTTITFDFWDGGYNINNATNIMSFTGTRYYHGYHPYDYAGGWLNISNDQLWIRAEISHEYYRVNFIKDPESSNYYSQLEENLSRLSFFTLFNLQETTYFNKYEFIGNKGVWEPSFAFRIIAPKKLYFRKFEL